FIFIFDDLAVNFVHQQINGGVEVLLDGLAVHILSSDAHGYFRAMFDFFYRQLHLDVDDMIEMPQDTFQLIHDMGANGRCNHKMMSVDGQIHVKPSFEHELGEAPWDTRFSRCKNMACDIDSVAMRAVRQNQCDASSDGTQEECSPFISGMETKNFLSRMKKAKDKPGPLKSACAATRRRCRVFPGTWQRCGGRPRNPVR